MKKEIIYTLLGILLVVSFFFYPIFKGYLPFPGELLAGEFAPYKSYSYLGYPAAGIPNKGQGIDVIRQLYPWKYFVIDSFKHGQIPFWTPYNFSGNPLMANFQSGIFYPFNLLFFVLPFMNAWTVYIFLIPVLAALFTYFYLREMQLSKFASVYGGIIFAFSSWMVVSLEWGNVGHTFLWLPLALFFTERYLKKSSNKNILFLILALWFSMLAGYIQLYFYASAVLYFYYLVKAHWARHLFSKKTGLFTIILFLPIGLSLFQLLPTFELFGLSNRTNYSLSQIHQLLNPVWYMITVLIPDFFGNPASRNYWYNGTYVERVSYFGVIPFIFTLIAIANVKKRKESVIFTIIFLLTLFLATDFFITKYIYLLPIPTLSTTVPTRILTIFEFAGAILSAIGLDEYYKKNYNKKTIIAFVIPLITLISAWVFIFVAPKIIHSDTLASNLTISKRNMILPTIFISAFLIMFFIQMKAKHNRTMLTASIMVFILLTVCDLFYFFQKITPFSPPQFMYPSTPVIMYLQKNAGINRFWGYGSGYLTANIQTYDRTYSSEGYDPLYIKTYMEFISSGKDGSIPKQLTRSDANIPGGYGSGDLNNNLYRQKILNILGVKYVLNKNDLLGSKEEADTLTFNPSKYTLVWQSAPWQIYQNLNALPRIMTTADYKVISNKNEVITTIMNPKFNEHAAIILNENPHIKQSQSLQSSIEIKEYQPNNIEISTNTNKDSLLFISDNYYPGWNASIDNMPTKILKADYTFRAIVLPKGNHMVKMYYDPNSFKQGLIISAILAVIIAVLLFYPLSF